MKPRIRFPFLLVYTLALVSLSSCNSEDNLEPSGLDLEWSFAGNSLTDRNEHQIILFNRDELMVIGGVSKDKSVESININDYSRKSLSPLNIGRESHRAVRLNENEILVIGGYTNQNEKYTRTCEVYNHQNNGWKLIAEMNEGRASMGAIKLSNGKVLIAGGFGEMENSSWGISLSTAELFDPVENKWTFVRPMKIPKAIIGLYQISDSEVLVHGRNDVEIYNFELDEWNFYEEEHSNFLLKSTQLDNGDIFFANGDEARIFDVNTREWTVIAPMNINRAEHTLTYIGSDLIIAIGGERPITEEERDSYSLFSNAIPTKTCEYYDLSKNRWKLIANLRQDRTGHYSVLLNNRRIFLVGGWSKTGPIQNEISSPVN